VASFASNKEPLLLSPDPGCIRISHDRHRPHRSRSDGKTNRTKVNGGILRLHVWVEVLTKCRAPHSSAPFADEWDSHSSFNLHFRTGGTRTRQPSFPSINRLTGSLFQTDSAGPCVPARRTVKVVESSESVLPSASQVYVWKLSVSKLPFAS
jgi:hypothetical protein